jgi:pilus assembly protein Flp/PilA
MMRFLKAFYADCDGATAVEYGLIVALIGAFIIGALSAVASAINGKFTLIANTVK